MSDRRDEDQTDGSDRPRRQTPTPWTEGRPTLPPAPEPPAPRRAPRRAAWLVTAAVIVVSGGVSVALERGANEVAGPGTRLNPTILSDDFSDPSSGWPSPESLGAQGGYVDGAFRIYDPQARQPLMLYLYLDEGAQDAISVEANVWAAGEETSGLFGVSCAVGQDDAAGAGANGYAFLVDPTEGQLVIARWDGDRLQAVKIARDLGSPPALFDPARPNHVRGECVGDGGTTHLAMIVNDHVVLTADDPGGFQRFSGMGLTSTGFGSLDARFDDAVATRISVDAVRSPVAAGVSPVAAPVDMPGRALLRERFDDERGGWFQASAAAYRLRYLDGAYEIWVGRDRQNRYAVHTVAPSVADMGATVAVSITQDDVGRS